jgi:hypothetical protein
VAQLPKLDWSRSFVGRHPELSHEILPGTFSMIPPPLTPEAMAWAAFLWASPALLSHLTALWKYGLADPPPQPHVLIAHRRRLVAPTGVLLHRTSVIASKPRTLNGLRVTAPARTLVDSAALLPPRELLAATAASAQRRLCQPEELRRYAVAHPGLPGAARMTRALAKLDGGLESIREFDLLASLRAAGLPEPVAQFAVHDASGRLVRVPDFAYPQWKIAIYYDGRAAHLGIAAFDGDALKTAAPTAAGWRVLRVTNALLQDADLLAAAVRQLVEAAA